jgi:hypothetical protein
MTLSSCSPVPWLNQLNQIPRTYRYGLAAIGLGLMLLFFFLVGFIILVFPLVFAHLSHPIFINSGLRVL